MCVCVRVPKRDIRLQGRFHAAAEDNHHAQPETPEHCGTAFQRLGEDRICRRPGCEAGRLLTAIGHDLVSKTMPNVLTDLDPFLG